MSTEKKLPEYEYVDGFALPKSFDPKAFRDTVKYKPKDDDVFVITYPKCGTTWMQYLIYLIYYDAKEPSDMIVFNRTVPFLEMMGIDAVDKLIKPGILKTHLPFNLQPYSPKARYIVVVRNPKDCCVSFYHHTVMHPAYNFEDGDFDLFFDLFMDGKTDYGDYFDHLLSWYEHKDDPNLLMMLFEDMKHQPKESVYKVASFLGDEYKAKIDKDPSHLDKILHLSSSDSMKKAVRPLSAMAIQPGFDVSCLPSGMQYMVKDIKKRIAERPSKPKQEFTLVRKGQTGGWKEVFSKEQNERMDKRIQEKLGGTDILKHWKDGGYV